MVEMLIGAAIFAAGVAKWDAGRWVGQEQQPCTHQKLVTFVAPRRGRPEPPPAFHAPEITG